MNTTDARDAITTAKENDELVMLTLADGTTATGAPISVNSKGVNIKVDDKVRSFSLNRVKNIDLVTEDDEDTVPEDVAAMLHDGMTTAELAELLDTEAKILRVHLRALGWGVGKGRKYSLTPSAYTIVRNRLAEDNA